ncbi:ABZJ_00895 family protein [Verticiella alkaliphila]|uniref:ABZJ_00895 family protein n=1 Tax=Verticiella alkaliphila TaxID=2779529 RepID=UPI00209A7797|nr:ABZJ_00895 family protein [Verticiella sp. GG226]
MTSPHMAAAESAARRSFALWLVSMLIAYVVIDMGLQWSSGQALPSDLILALVLLSAAMMAAEAHVKVGRRAPTGRSAWRLSLTFAIIQAALCMALVALLSLAGLPMAAAHVVVTLWQAEPGLVAGMTLVYLVVWLLVARVGLSIGASAAVKRQALAARMAPPARRQTDREAGSE